MRIGRGRLAGSMAVVIGLGACGVAQLGAAPENLARARSSAAAGADVFARHCARCHGERGEGTASGPAVMGAGALPTFPSDQDRATKSQFSDPQSLEEEARARPAGAPSRDAFRNALDVHAFVSTRMPRPKDRVGSLQPGEYWAVVTFILTAHGSSVPEGGVNEANAGSIAITPE